MRIHADLGLDPRQTLESQQVEFLHENRLKNIPTKVQKPFQKTGKGLFLNFGQLPCFWIRIRIPILI
jgi:hypothetical protein